MTERQMEIAEQKIWDEEDLKRVLMEKNGTK